MLHLATRHNVTVPVTKNGRGFCVAWQDTAAATRRRRTFTDYAKACQFADATARRIADGQKRTLTVTDAELATLDRAAAILAPHGTPLLAAVEEYAAARARLGTMTLTEAVTIAVARCSDVAAIPPTPEIVAALLRNLTQRDRDPEHIRQMRRDLTQFAATFPNLRTVTTAHIEDYLHAQKTTRIFKAHGTARPAGSPVSKRTRDNILANVNALLRFAQGAGYLAEGKTVADRVPRLDHGPAIHIYTPDQLAQILDWFSAHAHHFIPFIALGAFAGMRSSEILRLDWSAVRWRQHLITIPASVAKKVKIPRKLEMQPVLEAWLRPWSHITAGQVVPGFDPARTRAINTARRRMVKAFGWTHWSNNALRHSYASHRLVIRPDKAAVAIEMGTSPAMLDAHYNNPPDPTDATAYFNLHPEQPTNITTIKTA